MKYLAQWLLFLQLCLFLCVFIFAHISTLWIHRHIEVYIQTLTHAQNLHSHTCIHIKMNLGSIVQWQCLAIEINVHIIRHIDRVQWFYRASVCKSTILLQPFSDILFRKPFIYLDISSYVSFLAQMSQSCFLRRIKGREIQTYIVNQC